MGQGQEDKLFLPLCKENGMMQKDTTDGRHESVCGVYHMEYLEIADRLGRNFCNDYRSLCSGGRFL